MTDPVIGLVLAGGLSTRMGGGDKTLLTLDQKPILQHVIDRLTPQVNSLLINANGDPKRFAHIKAPIIADTVGHYAGPLAGILAGLEWMIEHSPDTNWMVSIAADTPFFPLQLVAALMDAVKQDNSQLAVARSHGFCHPVIGLWSTAIAPALRHALTVEHIHKVDRFTQRYSLSIVDFNNEAIDPFFNINSPDELVQAQQWIAQQKIRIP